MTTIWAELRATLSLDEANVAKHRATLGARQQAYRFQEIRHERGITLTQPTVSDIESGDLEQSALGTAKKIY